MATLAQYRTKVRDALGVPSNDPMFNDTRLNTWINDALADIAAHRPWVWLRSTQTINTGATWPVALPADWVKTQAVYVNGWRAHPARYPASYNEVGGSYKWAIDSNGLYVYPTPNGVTQHFYLSTENTLVNDNDTPKLPAAWDRAVVAHTCHAAKLATNNMIEAREWANEYTHWLDSMLRAQPRHPDLVRVDRGRGII